MYKVISYFTDLHDNDHPYEVGDTFPREGVQVSDDRLAELAGSNNRQKRPLIELAGDEPAEESASTQEQGEEPKEPAKGRGRSRK